MVALADNILRGFEVKYGRGVATKPRFLKHFVVLGRETIPWFLASIPFI